MLQKLRERAQNEKGFTLIELLVVILIIGILAAIAIPAFLSQRQKGQDSAAKSIARTAQTAMEACATDNNGSYTTCTTAKLKEIEPALNDSKFTNASNQSDTGYTVTATNNSRTATITKTATSVTRGGDVGTW